MQTRSQTRKEQRQLEEDQRATASSGVVLTAPGDPTSSDQEVAEAGEGADALSNHEAPTSQSSEEKEDVTEVVARADLIQWQQEDPALAEMLEEAEQPDSPFHIVDGLLYRAKFGQQDEEVAACTDQSLIVVPSRLREKVMKAAHDQAGHFGVKKSKQLIQGCFYWPAMGQDISKHCKSCSICLKYNYKKTRREPLHPLPVIATPWERIAIDIVGKMPRTRRGNVYILTIMDFATRYMEAIPLRRVDAKTTCNALLEVFARYGVPKELLSDNGSNFIAGITESLMKMLGVYHIKSSPFHPATNGMLERSHQVLKKTVDKLGATVKNWDEYLPQTLMALRTAPHAALGMTPFHLLFGRLLSRL